MQTPADEGWYMPAEWARHKRTWMAFPTRADIWVDIEATRRNYAEVARAIAQFEPCMLIANPEHTAIASAMCGPSVGVVALPIDDSWIRDSGPTFLLNRRRKGIAAVDWIFNAWGEKYFPHDQDAMLSERLLGGLNVERFAAPLCTEGGAIHTDSNGTLLTTETAVLNTNRNPNKTKAEVDQIFKDYLGVKKIVWLPGSEHEVETNGHIDLIASFAQPGVVLADVAVDPSDPEYHILKENLRALQTATDARGNSFEIVPLLRPTPVHRAVERFSASYMNFYICNGGVIAPSFGDVKADAAAVEVLSKVFPDHRVVQIDINAIAVGGGGIHCITQQEPL